MSAPEPPRAADGTIGDWVHHPVPEWVSDVPTMLIPDELRLLHHLTENYYNGTGCVVDAGSFLGGSTVALADGLRRNLVRRGLPERPMIHSYDRFEVEQWTRDLFFPSSTPVGSSFREQFERNTSQYAGLVQVHDGDIMQQRWTGGPIEILFVDVAKHWMTCDWVTWQLFPHLIPGRSIVVQQDYLYQDWNAWLHVTMELYAEYFEYVCDTRINSVAFRYSKRIPADMLHPDTFARLSTEEKVRLMDRAAARFPDAQAELLHASKRHFLEMLDRLDRR